MKEYIDKLKEIETLVELSIGTTMTEEKATDIYELTNDLMCKVRKLNIPDVSCSFSDGEIVIYGEDKVEIQGIWKDWATIKFDDGDTINVGVEELKKLDAEPKYRVGQKIKVGNWSGETEPLEILDIKKTYHRRLQEYCWGYKMNGYTGLTMEYVPEGYLRP